jgi:phage terminase|uniref:Large Terminase n=1 Tax=Siphoviridae sp. ctmP938 TaxID=2827933 RepID=A0A8S5S4D3_9CAUD|nr:MAG TPA: Large Terminase [Siphoviridae sp. ctmP938]
MTCLEEIMEYAQACISGKIPAGTKHIWACQRLLRDVERIGQDDFPYIWDEERAEKIVTWFSLLRHSKGELAGTPIHLTAWQKFRECQLYGWRHKESGRKRFHQSFTEVGRKNAKSQLEAGEALNEISEQATRNNEVYEVYTAGVKRDQSKIVFTECDLMTRGTLIRPLFRFKRDEIVHVKTGSFIKALSKEDGKKGDGTNPAVLIIDEYHQHPDTDFYDLGLGSNVKDKMLTIITTAGKDLTYPCYTQEYAYCSKILNPDVDVWNDSYFVDICEADKEDDPGELTTWQKANPIRAFYPAGIDMISSAYEIARQMPEKMIAFQTKVLNIWVSARKCGYMDMQKWKACEVSEFPVSLEGRPVYVGFDMSSKIDLTSIAFIVPYESEAYDESGKKIVKYLLWSHSFIPTYEALREHVLRDKAPYDAWKEQGFLTVTDTPIVHQGAVMHYVRKETEKYKLDVRCLCFDPANASKLMMDLSAEGYTVEEVYQSHRSLNESTCGFREQVYEQNVLYLPNPVLTYAMSNAVTRVNGGLIKIDKDAATQRVDPVDATLCAFKLALYHDFEAENYDEYVANFLKDMGV